MLRNLPIRSTIQQLIQHLDQLGFQGKYDFVHAPARWLHAPTRTLMHTGYAFVNLIDAETSGPFAAALEGTQLAGAQCEKLISVSGAKRQGLEENMAAAYEMAFRKGSGSIRRKPCFLPWVLRSGTARLVPMPLEPPSRARLCEGSCEVESTATDSTMCEVKLPASPDVRQCREPNVGIEFPDQCEIRLLDPVRRPRRCTVPCLAGLTSPTKCQFVYGSTGCCFGYHREMSVESDISTASSAEADADSPRSPDECVQEA